MSFDVLSRGGPKNFEQSEVKWYERTLGEYNVAIDHKNDDDSPNVRNDAVENHI